MPYSLSRVLAGAALFAIFAVTLAACSQQPEPQPTQIPVAAPTAAPQAPTAAPPAPTAAPQTPPTAAPAPTATAEPTPKPEPTAIPTPEAPAKNTFILGEGTIARYKVEEELARQGYFVATGETTEVVGRITFDDDGEIVPEGSGIIMQAATLKTDSDRRDRYVRERTLQTAEFPAIDFRPKSADGLPWPLDEASGTVEFSISGDLTIRDQTRPVTWDVTAEFGDAISGLATVDITFEQFAMEKPSVAIVLSVDDTIRLELEFVGTFEEASATNVDGADDQFYAQLLGDGNAPVTVIEFSDFQ